jgi:hypothetical protein
MRIGGFLVPAFICTKGEKRGRVVRSKTEAKAAIVWAWKIVALGTSRPIFLAISANSKSAVRRLPPRLKKLSSTPMGDRRSRDCQIEVSIPTVVEAEFATEPDVVTSTGAIGDDLCPQLDHTSRRDEN